MNATEKTKRSVISRPAMSSTIWFERNVAPSADPEAGTEYV